MKIIVKIGHFITSNLGTINCFQGKLNIIIEK